ncbi:hypothetical protein Lnau_1260 [Legionella nautarum]|uniref:Coiled coil protein n=2 Tax=Legionella nautarum TaxID=45070 RepID=A0A0W0WVI0_9GAMM|nr:hypothetical protein Lnau_1260 [Legionella nautarum]
MLRTLNKISGAIVGFVVYPIKSAIINTALFAGTLVFATLVLFVLPIFAATDYYRTYPDSTLAKAIWRGMALGIVSLLLGIPFAIIILAAEIVFGVVDLIRSFWNGIADGYQEGLFFNVIKQIFFNFADCSLTLELIKQLNEKISQPYPPAHDDLDVSGEYAALDVPEENTFRVSNKEPPLDSAAYSAMIQETDPEVVFLPLSEKELELVQGRKAIKVLLENYRDLDARLTKLNEEIEKRRMQASEEQINEAELTLDSDLDQVAMSDIHQPILIVQMFEASPDQWRVVTGTTKISCDITLRQWLCEASRTHPLTNEPINNPSPYREKKTKYVITPYTDKRDAKELVEVANLIRRELYKNSEESRSRSSIGVVTQLSDRLSHMFFGAKPDEMPEKGAPNEDNSMVFE